MVNAALGLPPGKMAVQVAHASVGALLHASRQQQTAWFEAGMPKVAVVCASEAELMAILDQAQKAGLPAMLVRDAGRTVVAAGTATCVGIGPAPTEDIDRITGALKLAP